MKHYTIYKTTNAVNGKIYVGQHITEDLDDDYIGSGTYLCRAINKYGKDKFVKEILYDFDNEDEMDAMEVEIVDEEFIDRKDTYNLVPGGRGGCGRVKGFVIVKDRAGNIVRISKDDPRYLSGELVFVQTGMINARDKDGSYTRISREDPRYLSGELKHNLAGMVVVKDYCGTTTVVSIDDPRYLSGELVPLWTGKKHTEETKRKIGEANSKHQRGSRNSQYGTYWVVNFKLQKSVRIKCEDLAAYISLGYQRGRCLDFSGRDDEGNFTAERQEQILERRRQANRNRRFR